MYRANGIRRVATQKLEGACERVRRETGAGRKHSFCWPMLINININERVEGSSCFKCAEFASASFQIANSLPPRVARSSWPAPLGGDPRRQNGRPLNPFGAAAAMRERARGPCANLRAVQRTILQTECAFCLGSRAQKRARCRKSHERTLTDWPVAQCAARRNRPAATVPIDKWPHRLPAPSGIRRIWRLASGCAPRLVWRHTALLICLARRQTFGHCAPIGRRERPLETRPLCGQRRQLTAPRD